MLSFGNISIAATKNGEFDFRVGNGSYPLTREDAQELVDWLNNKLMRPAYRNTTNMGWREVAAPATLPVTPHVMQELDNAVEQLAANAEF